MAWEPLRRGLRYFGKASIRFATPSISAKPQYEGVFLYLVACQRDLRLTQASCVRIADAQSPLLRHIPKNTTDNALFLKNFPMTIEDKAQIWGAFAFEKSAMAFAIALFWGVERLKRESRWY